MKSAKFLILSPSSYLPPFPPLPGAALDGTTFRDALMQHGVPESDIVYAQNAGFAMMLHAAREFNRRLSADSVGVMIYAGHSVEIDGENYLIPSDALCQRDDRALVDLPGFVSECIGLNVVLDYLSLSGVRNLFVLLDACRNNPFRDRFMTLFERVKDLAYSVFPMRDGKWPTSLPDSDTAGSSRVILFSTQRKRGAIDQLRERAVSPFCEAALYGLVRNYPIHELGLHVKITVEEKTANTQSPDMTGVPFECQFVPSPARDARLSNVSELPDGRLALDKSSDVHQVARDAFKDALRQIQS